MNKTKTWDIEEKKRNTSNKTPQPLLIALKEL